MSKSIKKYAYCIEFGHKEKSSCYYIGQTSNFKNRLEDHAHGKGSVWTKHLLRKDQGFKIVKSGVIGEISNSLEEDHITEKYMMLYGGKNFEFVRGGTYT